VLLLRGGPETLQHLWFTCPALQAARADFGRTGDRSPGAQELRRLCRQCLTDPSFLPPILANYGVPVELGADFTHHWWVAEADGPGRWSGDAAGAWPLEAYPNLAGFSTGNGTTARQAVERRLGPTPSAAGLAGKPATGVAPWEPTVFTDGKLEHGHPWAPWMALGSFSIWAPGRREGTAPREEQEAAFLYHQWERAGLLQWGSLAGIAQSASRPPGPKTRPLWRQRWRQDR
jgi:hypothetical protein